MKRLFPLALLALVAALPVTAQTNPFAARLLAAHNAARAEAGTPPLEWNPRLAAEAQAWAEHLAEIGRMEHSDRDTRAGVGENLWMGSAGRFGAEFMVGAFVAERQHYRPGTFPHVSTTGQWSDVGHYTQVVWRETRQLGCAVARGARDDFLVCRYWPAGNVYDREVM
ncbi:CAP domain-containing protein [Aurantiacibacter luteus]|uniref:SCP-like extracellular n=1 Tax=Aurantiacibacter luteus TaxID=1581420 RepID=A0A0G9MXR9_9SPHN|nr:CAP domain-containing protein [Aurantiacibacter luteus]KLE35531.1 SCP-like extracellular [Aurantiacibacter luteus]